MVAASSSVPVPQAHGSYLVAEDDGGVIIIDQHALHERIMFSTLLERVTDGTLDPQRMLAPVVVRSIPSSSKASNRSGHC